MFIQVSRSETVLIDSSDRVRGRNKNFSNIPRRMVNRTANAKVKMLPAIQNALDLWTIMSKIVKDRH
jgi:hypothetical protein